MCGVAISAQATMGAAAGVVAGGEICAGGESHHGEWIHGPTKGEWGKMTIKWCLTGMEEFLLMDMGLLADPTLPNDLFFTPSYLVPMSPALTIIDVNSDSSSDDYTRSRSRSPQH